MGTQPEVLIVGGGIAGLSLAFALAQRGLPSRVLDAGAIGHGTTWAAAGMLAPAHELEFQELELLALGRASLKLYEHWEELLGPTIGLNRTGTLEVALTADDVPHLQRFYDFQKSQGLDVHWLMGAALQALEPALSRNLPAGILAPGDWQVDNRRLVAALTDYLSAHGCLLHPNERVVDWQAAGQQITVQTEATTYTCHKLVLTTGPFPVPNSLNPPEQILPIKGQMLSLLPTSPQFGGLQYTVRIKSRSWGNAYLVPKADRLVLGSTAEEMGSHRALTAGGMLDILRKAYAAVPGIYDLPILEHWTGLRPSTLSRQPLVAQHPTASVWYLNGLYRHGILLGPVLGEQVAEMISTNASTDNP